MVPPPRHYAALRPAWTGQALGVVTGDTLAMREISGAVVATSLVLLAVFVPVGFFPGTTGQLYKQFALTIAISISISLFNALTLTPALSAIFRCASGARNLAIGPLPMGLPPSPSKMI